MTVVMLWLIFVYGLPLFPAPLVLNLLLPLRSTENISVDDIRLRYNILTATPEIIVDNLQVGDENFNKIVIGLNSRWSLNNSQQKQIYNGWQHQKAPKVDFTMPSAPPLLGIPNYWEETKTFNVLASNAIFSYVIVRYAPLDIPIEIHDLLISPDQNSPVGFRLDGLWRIAGYRGKLSFSKKEGENLILNITSKRFNLLDVLSNIWGDEQKILDNVAFLNLDMLAGKKRRNALEEFLVDGKVMFDDNVSFQSADIKITSQNHYVEAMVVPSTERTHIFLRWNLKNLQTLLSNKIKLNTKLQQLDTQGSLSLYKILPQRGGLSGWGVDETDASKKVDNKLALSAAFNQPSIKTLNLQANLLPNQVEEVATDYAFHGKLQASKDQQKMDANFKIAKVGSDNNFHVQVYESLQSVCTMFDFCNALPANLIWGHDVSKLKGNYNIHITIAEQNAYEKIRGWRKIFFAANIAFKNTPSFDIPFINFTSRANSTTQIFANGYSYGNTVLVNKVNVSNEKGLSVNASNLQFQNGTFLKGTIESTIGQKEKSAFTISYLPDGTRKMDVVGDRVSFAPYLGFEKDRVPTSPNDIDFLDRHIDRKKLPDVYLTGQIKKLRLHGDYEWNNAKLLLVVRDERLEQVDFKSDQLTLFYKVGAIGDAVLKINGTHAGEMLNGLGVLSGIEGGKITFNAQAENADEPLIGSGEIIDSNVLRLGGVAKMFDLLSISGLLSENEGVPFDKIIVNAKMRERQIIFEEGIISGPSMEMTFAGRLDLFGPGTYIEGTYVPKNIITRILDIIPLLNLILPMTGDNAVIGTRYTIKGSLEDLKVRFNVGTILTPGILRGIFGKPTGAQEFIERGNKNNALPFPSKQDKSNP